MYLSSNLAPGLAVDKFVQKQPMANIELDRSACPAEEANSRLPTLARRLAPWPASPLDWKG
jgi:hypothetical protein